MTRQDAPRPSPRAPITLGAAGRWVAPILSIVGLLVVALITLNLLQGGVPFSELERQRERQRGRRAGPDAGALERRHRPARGRHPQGLDRLRQGGQHLGPDGQGRQAADQGRRRLDAVLGARRILDLLHPHGQRERPLARRQHPARVRADDPERDERQGRRQRGPGPRPERAGDQRRPDLACLDPRTGRVARTGRRWRWSRIARTRRKSDVVLQLYDLATKKSTVPKVAETPPLGHQDPAWRPDGKVLLYVRNNRNGARGAPVIYRLDVAKGTASALTGPGYLEPAFSPDGRYVVATKTSSFGNDLVILDAANGRELLRLTNDGASWAPVWSPIGDAIAFLHIEGQIVDLKLIRLEGDAPNWTVKDVTDLTEVSGLDGSSRPGWFVPPDQLPEPTPTPVSDGRPEPVRRRASPAPQ